jgi:hypothetical protein
MSGIPRKQLIDYAEEVLAAIAQDRPDTFADGRHRGYITVVRGTFRRLCEDYLRAVAELECRAPGPNGADEPG